MRDIARKRLVACGACTFFGGGGGGGGRGGGGGGARGTMNQGPNSFGIAFQPQALGAAGNAGTLTAVGTGGGGAAAQYSQPGANGGDSGTAGGSIVGPTTYGGGYGGSGGSAGGSIVGNSFITWVANGTKIGPVS